MRRFRLVVMVCAAMALALPSALTQPQQAVAEAPSGFDGRSNGLLTDADFDHARGVFEEVEGLDDGLGPVYNAQSCAECHQSPVTGGISQVTELRAGRLSNGVFV